MEIKPYCPEDYVNVTVSETGEITQFGEPLTWRYETKGGPPYVTIRAWRTRRKSRRKFVHYLVLETFVGRAPVDHRANFMDGDVRRPHVGNLRWVTRKELYRLHRKRGGKKAPRNDPKLDRAGANEVKLRLARGERQIDIAKDMNCSKSLISKIQNGVRWA